MKLITSRPEIVGQMDPETPVSSENMVWSASPEFAYENGGPLTKQFLDRAKPYMKEGEWIVDSKVVMLKPGWFPCIPGWHCDDVARDHSGQPDFIHPENGSEMLISVLSGGTKSKTLWFDLNEVIKLPGIKTVYKELDEAIHSVGTEFRDGSIVRFDERTVHRGSVAEEDGWRFFIRATKRSRRRVTQRNEIRTQVNVYLTDVNGGW